MSLATAAIDSQSSIVYLICLEEVVIYIYIYSGIISIPYLALFPLFIEMSSILHLSVNMLGVLGSSFIHPVKTYLLVISKRTK